MITISAEIENHYIDDGDVVITRVHDIELPDPPQGFGSAELQAWAEDHLYPLTGTGRTEGDSCYFMTITSSSDARLVGHEFEFGT